MQAQEKTREKCDIQKLISNFNDIDTNSEKLSDQYTVAWKYYENYVNQNCNNNLIIRSGLFDEANIKFLINNNVDINKFFSCAMVKSGFIDTKNIYNILSKLNINITAIYLNYINLGNILFYINNVVVENSLYSKVKEIHLKNTNLKQPFNNFSNRSNLEHLKKFFMIEHFPSLEILDISENEIDIDDLSEILNSIPREKTINKKLVTYVKSLLSQSKGLEYYTSNTDNTDIKNFIERYQQSLNPEENPLDPEELKRKSDHYLKTILTKVRRDIENNNIDINTFLTRNVKSVKDYKEQVGNVTFPKNINFIFYHGGISTQMKTVPSGCVLCILTPLNRFGVSDASIQEKFMTLINDPQFGEEFRKNPICYGKNVYNGLFFHANIYFSNQYYYDLNLARKNDMFEKKNGIFPSNKNSEENKTSITKFLNLREHNIEKKEYTFMLSTFLDQNGINNLGTVIVFCCRNLDYAKTEIRIGTTMYRYEHFLNLLNRSAMMSTESEYEKCDTITSIFKTPHKFAVKKRNTKNSNRKIRNSKKNRNNRTREIEQARELNSYIGDKLIGPGEIERRKLKKFCDDNMIINNFKKINPLTTTNLSEEYTVAWEAFIFCKGDPLDKKNILKFLIDNNVNMNIFFSCAISNLFNNSGNIIKLYNILISLKISITAIYLNTINFNAPENRLLLSNLIYLFQELKIRSLIEVHLKNTNFQFNGNKLYKLFITDYYPNITFIDISGNNITKINIDEFFNNIKWMGTKNPILITYLETVKQDNDQLQSYAGDLIFHTITGKIVKTPVLSGNNNPLLPNNNTQKSSFSFLKNLFGMKKTKKNTNVKNSNQNTRKKNEINCKEIIDIIINKFRAIDTNNLGNTLMESYKSIWNDYNTCKIDPFKEKHIDELIKYIKIDMNVFFSFIISKLFHNKENLYDTKFIKKIIILYNLLESKGVIIRAIYLNGIDLSIDSLSLKILVVNCFNRLCTTQFCKSLEEIHLKNSNLSFNTNTLDRFAFINLFNIDFYPKLNILDISDNNIDPNEIQLFISETAKKINHNNALIEYFTNLFNLLPLNQKPARPPPPAKIKPPQEIPHQITGFKPPTDEQKKELLLRQYAPPAPPPPPRSPPPRSPPPRSPPPIYSPPIPAPYNSTNNTTNLAV
uniref:Uncharacterized protein n=1 Tax=viral metagenome TaxID=1070528 RepID=A0A6C0EZI2_9ZZZZ